MKRKIISLLLALVMTLSLLPTSVWAGTGEAETDSAGSALSSGSGTVEDPYLIAAAEDLSAFRDKVNSSAKKSTSTLCAKLVANIDLSGQGNWTPIGCYTSYSDCVYYGGTFDGGGYTISGLTIDSSAQYQALFGYVKGGAIRNLTVVGSVTTAATSSAYAAGIVAYGNPVTVENCGNQVTVTATAKGYAAGVAAYLGAGGKVTNCTNTAEIKGCGDYVGGIIGTGTGGVTLENCFNSGAITNSGKPSGYSYCTGGIAGGVSGTSTVTRCGNTGTISSTIKRTGGVVGSAAGTISACFNTGAVTGIYAAGGVVGSAAAKDTKISDCYNWGDVTCAAPAATFSDTSAKGVGGIIGDPSSTSNTGIVLTNCYSAGSVTNNDTATNGIVVGGVIGSSAANSYSGVPTSGLVTATNCYYLAAEGLSGDGANTSAAGIIARTDEELKASDMAAALGGSYISQNGNYPILGWQDPNAAYTVKFDLSPATAALTVKQDGVTVDPVEGTSYALKNGTYTYEVSADEYKPERGSFTVAYGGQNISVSLQELLYDVVFTTVPADAVLTVDGRTPEADGRTYRLPKSGNPYSYTLKAFGYEEKSGRFTVTGDTATDAQNITMASLPAQAVTFGAVAAEDGKAITPAITVTCPAWPAQALAAQGDGSYLLPAGDYSYTISCPGYKSVKGTFTVASGPVSIPAVTLAVQTAWDGETYTEPQKDESGAYLIGSPDELMWFDKNAETTDSARLTADICINEDMTADASSLCKWTPIGTSSSRYTGTFDGDGHTISGVYISVNIASTSDVKSNYTGLFGYAGKGSKICNLTISDSKIENISTASNKGKYVGAIAGDAYDMENCHVAETVSVHSTGGYTGGVAGYVDNSIARCSNAGTITSSGTYVGGVIACLQSNSSSAMTECFNTGSVSGSSLVGGVVGSLYNGGTISDVYNTGSVTAMASSGAAGGITGLLRSGAVKNTYQCGPVTAASGGSVAGRLEWSSGQKTLDKVYVLQTDMETVGNLNSCVIQNGSAETKSAEELKALAPALGDKFTDDAAGINQGYPILKWQSGGDAEPDPDQPAADPAGWDGKTAAQPKQSEGVYQIGTAAELKWFANTAKTTPDVKGALTTDIDLNHRNWTPIGGSTADTAFTGVLDGQGHTISNFYCKTGGAAGLFNCSAGTIRNLTVSGKVIGGDNTAAIAAQNTGLISGCTAQATVTGGNYTAGIAAVNNGTLTSCTNTGAISGNRYVGGICGENKAAQKASALVENCVNTGMIRAADYMLGGVVGNNESYGSDFATASVKHCANSGHVIGTAAIIRAYTGGVVGRNNGTVDGLYNTGCVESLGGCVGGALGLNLSKAEKNALYNTGDVTGGDYEDDGYPTDNAVSSAEELKQAEGAMGDVIDRLGKKTAITGKLAIKGEAEVGATVTAQYSNDDTALLYVWYFSYDENDDVTLAITDSAEYTIPLDMAGRRLRVKILCAENSGVLKAETKTIKGLAGTLKIEGAAVVERTLKAVFQSTESYSSLHYQWYRGTAAIPGADSADYTVVSDDVGKVLTVKVTSSTVAGEVKTSTAAVKTAAQADMWELAECSEPANVGGVYQITNEKELHWFASEVNGGNTAISAKLLDNIVLTTENWYPIGRSGHAFAGTFSGNGKAVTGLKLTSAKDETGFFGLIADGGRVQALSVSGTVTATGDVSQTGGIAGGMSDKGDKTASAITDCSFSGSVSGNIQVGGIVGSVGLHNKVEQCANRAAVTGAEQVGGIAGANSYGEVRYCFNTGAVGSESAKQVGGVVGDLQNYAELVACYNTGSVTGADYTGGVAGNVYVASMPLGCYNVGDVSAAMHCGGAVGSFGGDEYITLKTGSFYKGPLSAAYKANGAKERTEAQMKDASFVAQLNSDAYGKYFTLDKKAVNGGYPILLWQADSFEVTFDPNGGTCETRTAAVVVNGSLDTLPTPYRWNYRFEGWFTDVEGGDVITTQTVFTDNITVYAHWTLNADEQDAKIAAAISRLTTLYNSLGNKAEDAYRQGVAKINAATSIAEVEQAYQAAVVAMRKAADDYGAVRVIVENTTYAKDSGAPWDGTMVDTTVPLTADSTMLSCVQAALKTAGCTCKLTNAGYIVSINDLKEFDGGKQSGWMSTLNDWFVNEGLRAFTVSAGKLASGDVIRVMYTSAFGEDIGGTWSNCDTTLKSLDIAGGKLTPDFASGEAGGRYDYTVVIDSTHADLTITPIAGNKNFQVKTFLNEKVTDKSEGISFYKRTESIPVQVGDTVYVGCGEKGWDSMNNQDGNIQTSDGTWYVLHIVSASTDGSQVQDMINTLPDPITYSSYQSQTDAVAAVRAAYNALSDEEKAKVTNLDQLMAAEQAVKDFTAVDAFKTNQLASLPEADQLTLADRDTVKAAKDAYDLLNDTQKACLTNKEKAKLEAVFARMAEIEQSPVQEVEKLIDAIGEVTLDKEGVVQTAKRAYDALTDAQRAAVDHAKTRTLEAALAKLELLRNSELRDRLEKVYKTTGDYLSRPGTLDMGSAGGDWIALGLARSGRSVPVGYYDDVVKYVQQNILAGERLDRNKSTENSRVILALSAIGRDVTDVAGHNLLKGLDSMAYIQKQGINGPIWALIALDSHNYPTDGDVTREKLVQAVLDAQLSNGGWTLSGETADPDITAMAIQALVPYYGSNDKVREAVNRALEVLSAMQAADGGFASWGSVNSESCAQVLVALTALGIDPATDSRFLKNGNSVLDALCGFYISGGGFKHIVDGDRDGMATEQGYYALAAYYRFVNGQTRLYDMSDVSIQAGGNTPATPPAGDTGVTVWLIALSVSAICVVAVIGKKKREG